jgi:hypothetical protein
MLLVTLVISTQLSAQTVREALNVNESCKDFFAIVNNVTINNEAQAKIRNQFNRSLNEDVSSLLNEMTRTLIQSRIEKLTTIISPLLDNDDDSDMNGEDFSDLAQQVKDQLELLINPPVTPAIKEEIVLSSPVGQQFSQTHSLVSSEKPLPATPIGQENQNSSLAQLVEELKPLDESSSSDDFFLNHGDLVEEFMATVSPKIVTKDDYRQSLDSFLTSKNLTDKPNGPEMLTLADTLFAMQRPVFIDQADEEDDDLDTLLDQLSEEEANQLALELGLGESTTDPVEEALPTPLQQFKINLKELNTRLNDPNKKSKHNLYVDSFVSHYNTLFTNIINDCKSEHNSSSVTSNQLAHELNTYFFGAPSEICNSVTFAFLVKALVDLQTKMNEEQLTKRKHNKKERRQNKRLRDKERDANEHEDNSLLYLYDTLDSGAADKFFATPSATTTQGFGAASQQTSSLSKEPAATYLTSGNYNSGRIVRKYHSPNDTRQGLGVILDTPRNPLDEVD